jgi:transmembrane sensor
MGDRSPRKLAAERIFAIVAEGKRLAPMSNIDRAREEAAMWLVLLDDDPDDVARRVEFDAWLSAERVNRDAWQAVGRTAALLTDADKFQNGYADSITSSKAHRPTVVRSRARRALAAAALGLSACILAIVGPTIALRLQSDHHTGVAEVETLHLDDGSSVRMGPGSALRVAFSSAERRVQILAGEALFDVTADATRPFRVVTRDAVTTVLGTRFDVSLLETSTSVVVARGHVQVSSRSAVQPIDLRAGDWVRVAADGSTERGDDRPDLFVLGPDHRVGVRNRPVAEVIERIRPWFAGRIVVADDEVGRPSVTGVFDAADPARALDALVGPQGGRVIRITPWLLIVSRS